MHGPFDDPHLVIVDGAALIAGGILPPEWHACVRGGGATAICTGIFGGCEVDSIHGYAERAALAIQRDENIPCGERSLSVCLSRS